jgi:hypothetical protein
MSAGVKQGLAYIFNNIHAKTIADLSSKNNLHFTKFQVNKFF